MKIKWEKIPRAYAWGTSTWHVVACARHADPGHQNRALAATLAWLAGDARDKYGEFVEGRAAMALAVATLTDRDEVSEDDVVTYLGADWRRFVADIPRLKNQEKEIIAHREKYHRFELDSNRPEYWGVIRTEIAARNGDLAAQVSIRRMNLAGITDCGVRMACIARRAETSGIGGDR